MRKTTSLRPGRRTRDGPHAARRDARAGKPGPTRHRQHGYRIWWWLPYHGACWPQD